MVPRAMPPQGVEGRLFRRERCAFARDELIDARGMVKIVVLPQVRRMAVHLPADRNRQKY